MHESTRSISLVTPPPRQYPNGLPPRYRTLLRDLLRQWIEQQQVRTDGLPGLVNSLHKLWPEARARQIEDAIWQHVILVQRGEKGKRGLLQLDWDRWIVLAMKRLQVYQLEEANRLTLIRSTSPAIKTVKTLKRASRSDVEVHARNRLSSSPSPAAFTSLMGSSTATPTKAVARPPSIASARSTPRPDEFSDQLTSGLQRVSSDKSSSGSDVDVTIGRFCERLREMPGYLALDSAKREDWEVVPGMSSPPGEADMQMAYPLLDLKQRCPVLSRKMVLWTRPSMIRRQSPQPLLQPRTPRCTVPCSSPSFACSLHPRARLRRQTRAQSASPTRLGRAVHI